MLLGSKVNEVLAQVQTLKTLLNREDGEEAGKLSDKLEAIKQQAIADFTAATPEEFETKLAQFTKLVNDFTTMIVEDATLPMDKWELSETGMALCEYMAENDLIEASNLGHRKAQELLKLKKRA